jgi:exodeoxyribonuclease V gamma subunit
VTFRLTVAASLGPLAEVLADELGRPASPDPFAPELVVLPGDGVRTWLTQRLARRLGAGPQGGDGIVANLDVVFPARLVARVLGALDDADPPLGRWSVGALGWTLHHLMARDPGAVPGPSDPVRARAVADLFDRYAMRRPAMVLQWSAGNDVDGTGAPLDEHHLWQPRLWRAAQAHLGGPTDAQRTAELTARLRAATPEAELADVLPPRVFVFGLATLPAPHLDLLAAIASHVDVHVLAPTPSPVRWRAVRDGLRSPLALPVPRTDPTVPVGEGHRLVTGWGRTAREAHILLLDAAHSSRGAVVDAPDLPEAPTASAPLLDHLRHRILADLGPGGGAGDDDPLPVLDPTDRSVRWHQCYGTARQVEVLRDALLHLFSEPVAGDRPRLVARDVAVLCADVEAVAPLVEAAFAGDPVHGIPAVPVRVADRSLRRDNPLLDTAAALLDLLEGRFRSSSVLAFASRGPVRTRFGIGPAGLGRLAEWAEATNVRWGLDGDDQEAFGLPPGLGVHTWRAGLDQLLLGAAMAPEGPRLGPGDVTPFPAVDPDDLDLLGGFADLVDALDRADVDLRGATDVATWCDALSRALVELCAVGDDESWQWRVLQDTVTAFRDEAVADPVAGGDTVDPADVATLFRARLSGDAGRPRFGSGAVTVSSLTAQRGVPHRVVCLLGLDDDVAAGALTAAEDLTADPPCVGDRDPRGEHRAQLLDGVLAAGERLLIFSTGHDLRTNAPVPPAVALAELADAIDSTVRTADGSRPSTLVTVHHPRQAWAPVAFTPGALDGDGPWSFDADALEAAGSGAGATGPDGRREARFCAVPLPEPTDDDGPITVDDLVRAVTSPTDLLLDRLGVFVAARPEPRDDRIPLTMAPLLRWQLAETVLRGHLDPVTPWDADADRRWEQYERRRGSVPPLAFGATALADAAALAVEVEARLGACLAGPHDPTSRTIAVEIVPPDGPPWFLGGSVEGVCGSTLVNVSASRLSPGSLLRAWVRLAALAADDPGQDWEALDVGRAESGDGSAARRLRLRTPDAATEVLEVVRDLRRRARCDAIPFFPNTSRVLHLEGPHRARVAWEHLFGDAGGRATALAHPIDFDVLAAEPPRDDERGSGWADGSASRLAAWAGRVWGTFERTTSLVDEGTGS